MRNKILINNVCVYITWFQNKNNEMYILSLLLLPFGYDQSLYLVNPDHWACFCCPLAMINPCTWWIPTIELASAALWLWSILVPGESWPLSLILLPFGYDQSLYLVNPDHWVYFCCPLAMTNLCTLWIPRIYLVVNIPRKISKYQRK